MCEDFQESAFYEGGPGNWVDSEAGEERGERSSWTKTYGFGGKVWKNGQPNADPRVGDQCIVTGGSGCNATYEYCSEQQGNLVDGKGRDCWQSNAYGPSVDIQRTGDAGDEVSTLQDPVGGDSQGQWLAHRVSADTASGIKGEAKLPNLTSIGITNAYAYPTNLRESGVLGNPWKHNEFSPRNRLHCKVSRQVPRVWFPSFLFKVLLRRMTSVRGVKLWSLALGPDRRPVSWSPARLSVIADSDGPPIRSPTISRRIGHLERGVA